MEEITEDTIEELVHQALSHTGPESQELLKDYMVYAVHFERDDLVALILERSIRQNRLIEKLQDYGFKTQTRIPFLFDDDEDDIPPPAHPFG